MSPIGTKFCLTAASVVVVLTSVIPASGAFATTTESPGQFRVVSTQTVTNADCVSKVTARGGTKRDATACSSTVTLAVGAETVPTPCDLPKVAVRGGGEGLTDLMGRDFHDLPQRVRAVLAMRFESGPSAGSSRGLAVVESSPVHVLVLLASVVLLTLTVAMIVMLWRDSNRNILEKTTWSVIALFFPVIGTVVVGVALVWHRARDAKTRGTPSEEGPSPRRPEGKGR